MKHECERLKEVTVGIKINYPDCENITPPIELFSGRMYLNFTADRTVRGKKKQIDIPVLLSHCPFCGKKYESDASIKTNGVPIMANEPSAKVKKTKNGTSIEFKNINMKPEEFHKIIEESRKVECKGGC